MVRMDATTQGVKTTARTPDQTKPTTEVPDEHRYAVWFIREAMAKDGMDWRTTPPTKKYCMAMAVKAGRETCGDALGLKLREWAYTAPDFAEDFPGGLDDEEPGPLRLVIDGRPINPYPAAPEPEPTPEPEEALEPEEKRPGLRGLFRRTKETEQTEPVQTAAPEPESAPAPEPVERVAPTPEPAFHTGLSRLRFVPPIASLGLSAVMQVIIVTDLLGNALDDRYKLGGWAFVIAAAFGAGIACALEGSAAYILDLYKKHLLARDSTITLRALLLAYVSGSAAMIHWWTDKRELPWELALVLSLLAGSSIVLWTMGSKWENRERMRTNGQIDEALPRLSTSAKFWHPVRWIQTLALTSWEPVQTTAEARERHAVWSADRAVRKAQKKVQTKTDQTD